MPIVTSVWRRSSPSMRRNTRTCSSAPTIAAARKPAATPMQPVAGRRRHRVADIGAEEVERAVRQVDVAHQSEDQREAARHEEVEAGERHAVEDRRDEDFLRRRSAPPASRGQMARNSHATSATRSAIRRTGRGCFMSRPARRPSPLRGGVGGGVASRPSKARSRLRPKKPPATRGRIHRRIVGATPPLAPPRKGEGNARRLPSSYAVSLRRCSCICGRLWNFPSFMMASRRSFSCRTRTLAIGSPSTSSRSAR